MNDVVAKSEMEELEFYEYIEGYRMYSTKKLNSERIYLFDKENDLCTNRFIRAYMGKNHIFQFNEIEFTLFTLDMSTISIEEISDIILKSYFHIQVESKMYFEAPLSNFLIIPKRNSRKTWGSFKSITPEHGFIFPAEHSYRIDLTLPKAYNDLVIRCELSGKLQRPIC